MAKLFRVFNRGIKLVPINTSLGCMTDPVPCFSASDSGTLYVNCGKLRIFITSGLEIVTNNQAQILTNKTISGGCFTSPLLICDCPRKANLIVDMTQATGTICLTFPTITDTLVGRAATETLTNKTLSSPVITNSCICLGTSSSSQKLTVSSGTTACLAGLARKAGTIYYDTCANELVMDNGIELIQFAIDCDNFLNLTDTPSSYTCSELSILSVNVGATGIEFASSSAEGTTETAVVTTEAELDSAISGGCQDIIIGGSFNLTDQKEVPSSTTIRQDSNAFVLTGLPISATGCVEVSTITIVCDGGFATADYNCQQILIEAARNGTDQKYFIFFDDSACCIDTIPSRCGIHIRVCTNADASICNVATGLAAAINCHSIAGCDFTAVAVCDVVTITGANTGVVTDISQIACTYCEIKILVSPCAAASDNFGAANDICGCYAVFGVFKEDCPGSCSGAAYIFKRNTGGCCNWGFLKKLVSCDLADGDRFGDGVSIEGCYIVVTAPLEDHGCPCLSNAGAAYIFKQCQGGADNWGQIKKLTASDGSASDFFGSLEDKGVAICGCFIVVGAEGTDCPTAAGSAYIFKKNRGASCCCTCPCNWGELKILNASDAVAVDQFGSVVDISGCFIVINSPGVDECSPCMSCTGAVYIFKKDYCVSCMDCSNPCNWGELTRLTCPLNLDDNTFGQADVAICGCFLAVSFMEDDAFGAALGSVSIFKKDLCGPCNWGFLKKINRDCPAGPFGRYVDICGCDLIVGSHLVDCCFCNSGIVSIFRRNRGLSGCCSCPCNWGQIVEIQASNAAANDQFGRSVAISGEFFVAGAPLTDGVPCSSGSAYINKLICNTTIAVTCQGVDDTLNCITEGVQEISTITIVCDGCFATADYDLQQIIIQAPRFGTDQQYYVWFDDSACCTDPDPALCGISIRVCTNGDTTTSLVATGLAAAINCHACAGDDFTATSYENIVQIKNNRTGVVSDISQQSDFYCEILKLQGCDTVAGDVFRDGIELCMCFLSIGANREGCPDAGAVYIFRQNTGGCCNWGQIAKLKPPCPTSLDNFGAELSMCGCFLAIGAIFDDNPCSNAGSVFIHKRNTGGCCNWGLLKRIEASNKSTNDRFGVDVKVCGCFIFVGAVLGNPCGSGSGYIFKKDYCVTCMDCSSPCNWGELKTFQGSDTGGVDQFGTSLCSCGCFLVVGEEQDGEGFAGAGAAYVFKRNSTGGCCPTCTCPCNWGEIVKIKPDQVVFDARFGGDVAICGCYILIGGVDYDCCGTSAGKAFIFKRNQDGPCAWGQIKELFPCCLAASDRFGRTVKICGCTALVHSELFCGPCCMGCGGIFVFKKDEGGTDNWGQVNILFASEHDTNDTFGIGMDICGCFIVGGSSLDCPGACAGAAFIFKLTANTTVTNSTQGVEAAAMFNFAGCVNKSRLEGLNLTTTSNAISAVTVQNTANKNRVKGISVTTGSAPSAPIISVDGQTNIIKNNEIDTCTACFCFKVEIGTNATGNVSENNITD